MTETYNPMLNRQRISIWQIFNPFQTPPEDSAYVYIRNGVIHAVPPGQSYSWRTNDIRYNIDTSHHIISFDCTLPSSNDAIEFFADVQLDCHVIAPTTIVQRKITDACAALKPSIVRLMRLTSRGYDVNIDYRAKAEDAIRQTIEKQRDWSGFRVDDVIVRLSLDQEEFEHQRKLHRVVREIEFHDRETKLEEQRDRSNHKRRTETVEFYSNLIKKGYGDLVLVHLGDHPEEARAVAQQLVQLQKDDQNHWLDALMKLKNSDLLEDHHIQDVRNFILEQLKTRQKHNQLLEEMLSKSNGQHTN